MKTRGGWGASTTWPGVSRHDRCVSPLRELAGNRERARCASETRLRPIRKDPMSLSSRSCTTKGAGRFFNACSPSAIFTVTLLRLAHMLISASFHFILKGDDSALGLTAILVPFSSSLDPVDFGCSRRTSLACGSLGLNISTIRNKDATTYSRIGEGCPLAQTL